MYLKTDDVSLFVQSFGEGPRTIVAQGGWVGSGELWLPVFEGLSKSWRTITYAHRGTGATTSRAPRITFDLLVSDLFWCWIGSEWTTASSLANPRVLRSCSKRR